MTRTAKEILKVMIDLKIAKPDWIIRVRRTYSGHWQRACGAWKMWVEKFIGEGSPDEPIHNDFIRWEELLGSSDTCKDIINAHRREDRYVAVYDGPAGRELIAEIKALSK